MFEFNTRHIEKDIFDIFQKQESNHTKFKNVLTYIDNLIEILRVESAEEVYNEIHRPLMTSINNAGWEKRHDKQIDFLFELSHKLTTILDEDKY